MESKLTTRSQEAITSAQRLAVSRGQAALEPLHLLVALLEQTDGIAGPLLKAVGADPADVRTKADAALRRLPSVSGATVAAPSPSRELLRVLNAASEQAGALGDEFVSTEHLLVGLAGSEGEKTIVRLLRNAERCERGGDACSDVQRQDRRGGSENVPTGNVIRVSHSSSPRAAIPRRRRIVASPSGAFASFL